MIPGLLLAVATLTLRVLEGVTWAALAFHLLAALACLRHRPARPPRRERLPALCLMRPLCGLEPQFDDALTSVLAQTYPGPLRFVFGARAADDLALAHVRRRAAQHPELDIRIVVSGGDGGANPKVANLCAMWREAIGELIVVSDSDTHLPSGALRTVGEALVAPGVGAATALYFGRPGYATSRVQRFGAAYLDGWFAPSAVMHAALAGGVQVGYGPLVGLRREVLERGGGFAALRDTLADDTALAALARREGLEIALVDVWPETTVSDATPAALFAHELRWARTNRQLHPFGYFASVVMHPGPLPWLAVAWAHAPPLLGAALALPILRKIMMAALRAQAKRPARGGPSVPTLLLRDQAYFAVWTAGLFGRSVRWRGQRLRLTPRPPPRTASETTSAQAEAA